MKLRNLESDTKIDYLGKNTLSPQTRGNNDILKETREMLDFMTPIKNSGNIQTEGIQSANKLGSSKPYQLNSPNLLSENYGKHPYLTPS